MVPSVSATGLTFAYPNGKVLFSDLSVLAPAGTLTCVIGRSGIGKSTLLYCLAGVLHSTGSIQIMGQTLTSSPAQRAGLRLRQCGFIFQRGELLPELTVIENVALPLQLTGLSKAAARARAAEALEDLDIQDCCDRRPNEISGGQAQRASVARALIHRPAVVFADEPTASLDTVSRDNVLSALEAAIKGGAAVICATHDAALMDIADARLDLGETPRAARLVP